MQTNIIFQLERETNYQLNFSLIIKTITNALQYTENQLLQI